MSRTYILISGKQRSGKDTVANYLESQLSDFTKVSLATPLKELYSSLLGCSMQELEAKKNNHAKYRYGLIQLSEYIKTIDPQHWVEKTLTNDGNLIVADVRYVEEVAGFEAESVRNPSDRVFTVRLERPYDIRRMYGTLTNEMDPSETNLDNFTFDFTINNDRDMGHLLSQCKPIIDAVQASQ